MASRPTPDPEVVPLLRAIKARLDALSGVNMALRDGLEVYHRHKLPFMQLEIRRDHMSLDLWLSAEHLEESRASGIARAHPFLGDEAVKVRFERAEDLSRVARWIEASYEYAPDRPKKSPKKVVKAPENEKPIATPPPAITPSNSSRPAAAAAIEAPVKEKPAKPAKASKAASAKSNGAAKKAAPKAKAKPAPKAKAAAKTAAKKAVKKKAPARPGSKPKRPSARK